MKHKKLIEIPYLLQFISHLKNKDKIEELRLPYFHWLGTC